MRIQMMMAAAMCAAMCAVAAEKASKPVEPIVLPLKGTTVIEFIGIPAGEFTMGTERAAHCNNPSIIKLHKVTISRPFWMSKFKVTLEQWEAYKKVELTKYQQVMGGKSVPKSGICFWDAMDFCEWLTKRCRAKLPRGYVVRLPTEAEWEYALRINDDARDGAGKGKWKEFTVNISDIKRRAAEHDYALPNIADWDYGPIAVGTKKPNAIGLYDMIGNGREFVLDTFDRTSFATLKGWYPFGDEANVGKGLVYEDKEKDPLRHCKDTDKVIIITRSEHDACVAGSFMKLHENLGSRCPRNTIRLCIGPDLMKEKHYSFRRSKKKK